MVTTMRFGRIGKLSRSFIAMTSLRKAKVTLSLVAAISVTVLGSAAYAEKRQVYADAYYQTDEFGTALVQTETEVELGGASGYIDNTMPNDKAYGSTKGSFWTKLGIPWLGLGRSRESEEDTSSRYGEYDRMVADNAAASFSTGSSGASDALDAATNKVGRIRVVRTGWHFVWGEYGDQRPNGVSGLTPKLLPTYAKDVLNPFRYAANDGPNRENLLSLTRYVPVISGALVALSCDGNNLSPVETDAAGYVTVKQADLTAAGCPDNALDQKLLKAELIGYGVPARGSATYDYYIDPPEQSQIVIPVESKVAYPGTVIIAYRPTVAGRVYMENGDSDRVLPGLKVCLFYRSPESSDTCDKSGLSVSKVSDAQGYFLMYASWGDYASKGAGATAQLMAETPNGRYVCSEPFTIKGKDGNLLDCVITQSLTDSSSASSSRTNGIVAPKRRLVSVPQHPSYEAESRNVAQLVGPPNYREDKKAFTFVGPSIPDSNQLQSTSGNTVPKSNPIANFFNLFRGIPSSPVTGAGKGLNLMAQQPINISTLEFPAACLEARRQATAVAASLIQERVNLARFTTIHNNRTNQNYYPYMADSISDAKRKILTLEIRLEVARRFTDSACK